MLEVDEPHAGRSSTRAALSERQCGTLNALLDAALDQIRDDGYDSLTVRLVAQRAGVTHTTAYSYFSSKDELVAELYWRQVRALPDPVLDPGRTTADRIAAALAEPALLFDREPALSRAGLAALFKNDPGVERVRDAVGTDLAARIGAALGDNADPAVTETLLLTFSGAMLQAGLGYFDFATVVAIMKRVASLLDRG